MDKQLLDYMNANTPNFNPVVANGYAMYELKRVRQYVHQLFVSASNTFPEDLVYLGLESVTPLEEYNARVKRKAKTFDISKSTVRAVRCKFSYKGKPFNDHYLLLPYLEEGSMLTIAGSAFHVSPVMVDIGYSVGDKSIYLNMNRSKATFNQIDHTTVIDGQSKSNMVVATTLYRGRNSNKLPKAQLRATHAMETTPLHYLLANGGTVSGFFKEQFGIDLEIGFRDTITEETHDPSEWVLVKSTQVRPRQLRVNDYVGSNVVVAVSRDIEDNPYKQVIYSCIASMFYVIDFYPKRFVPQNNINSWEIWYHTLALTIKPDTRQEQACLSKLDEHFRSLATMVDVQVQRTLEDCGVHAKDVFDIFLDIIKTYAIRIVVDTDTLSTMFGKRLVVMHYLLENIRKNIFKMGFQLQNKLSSRSTLTDNDVIDTLRKHINLIEVLQLPRTGRIESKSNPTDCMIPSNSLVVKRQADMADVSKKRKTYRFDASLSLNASIAVAGTPTSDAKADMTGRSRLNPYMPLGPDGTILRNMEFNDLILRTQAKLTHG